MNRRFIGLLAATTLLSTCMATGGTLLILGLAMPQPVQAAPPKKELRIAIVNLERICRVTPRFLLCKQEWDAVQAEFEASNDAVESEYNAMVAKIQRARAADPDSDVLELRVEAQAIEQALKAAREEQKQYLAALLAHYQKEVLEEVYANLQRYVRQEGFNLVLQDYDNAAEDADFFSGEAYAQSMMSRPVLDAPWALDGDPHVADITPIMIKHMRAGGVPEKDD